MSRGHRLERSQHIDRPLREVFAFFSDAANLERLTPSFLHFQFKSPLPIEMKPGALIDYRIRLYLVPLDWRTRITSFEPERRFVDEQLRGPYKRWHHSHEFVAEDGGTRMRDVVDYEIPLGPLGTIAHAIFVRRTVEQIFDYRARKIAEIFA